MLLHGAGDRAEMRSTGEYCVGRRRLQCSAADDGPRAANLRPNGLLLPALGPSTLTHALPKAERTAANEAKGGGPSGLAET
jgi:hypothetical protein